MSIAQANDRPYRRPTKLTPPADLLAYQLIFRCIHQRGEDQAACLEELDRRGLWLTEDQKVFANLACWLPRRNKTGQ